MIVGKYSVVDPNEGFPLLDSHKVTVRANHRVTTRMQRRIYAHTTDVEIRPLNEEKAVQAAVDLIGEVFVFSILISHWNSGIMASKKKQSEGIALLSNVEMEDELTMSPEPEDGGLVGNGRVITGEELQTTNGIYHLLIGVCSAKIFLSFLWTPHPSIGYAQRMNST
ncbi:hypothetical protein K1719_005336 [Acacia pycnantha]|nr:hypothetical protein K1719_005336 [Acacia pycnantha]